MTLSHTPVVALLLAVGLTAQQWQRAQPLRGAAVALDLAHGETILFDGGTWRFDGADWRSVPTAHAPALLASGPMVYDWLRQRTVMVGGLPGNPADTWEFDGLDWTRRTLAVAPPARFSSAIAFDSQRGRVVMFGGENGNDLGDTWEYDGVRWQHVLGAAPQPRHSAALTYDLWRGRIVLFGGYYTTAAGAVPLDDTWEYDGTQWTQVVTLPHPSARAYAEMAFDLGRGRTVLFGGFDFPNLFYDTWEFDGANWTQRITQTSPPGDVGRLVFDPLAGMQLVGADAIWHYDALDWSNVADLAQPGPRRYHGLAHDRARGRTVLFGGTTGGIAPSNDTWELDDVHWRRVATPIAPPARSDHAFAYDSARQRMLLFGGRDAAGSPLQDTWTYDGANWSQQSTSHSPSARQGVAMADDEARARVVLFGGATATVGLADTWEYDGSDWLAVATSGSPAARIGHAMAFDGARNRIVLFGGATANSNGEADTWLYDGANWVQAVTANAPSGRAGHSVTYDAARGRMLVFGIGGPTSGDSWEFDGTDWQPVAAAAPAGAVGSRSAYDLGRRRVILYAGLAPASYPPEMSGDSWFFAPAPAPSWTRYGVGCAGSNGTPTLDGPPSQMPALGSTFALQSGSLPLPSGFALLVFGTGIVKWNGALLPLPLDAGGLPGCKAWLAPEAGVLVGHSGGAASFALSIPNNPALGGMLLATQAIVFDPAAAGGIGTVSNGGIMILH